MYHRAGEGWLENRVYLHAVHSAELLDEKGQFIVCSSPPRFAGTHKRAPYQRMCAMVGIEDTTD